MTETAPKSKNWGDLPARVASAIVLVTVASYALYKGGVIFWAFVTLFVGAACYEAGEMLIPKVEKGIRKVLHLAVIFPMAYGVIGHDYRLMIVATSVAIAIRPVYGLLVAFIGFGGWSFIGLRGWHGGMVEAAFAVVAVICSDTGAYFTGRIIGGPKLWARVSPGKTISGAIGALVATGAFSLWSTYHFHHGWLVQAAIWGVAISFVAQSGDLAESALKRWNGVKDSGKLIPGHGGVLDRVDGLLPVVILLYVLALFGLHPLLGNSL